MFQSRDGSRPGQSIELLFRFQQREAAAQSWRETCFRRAIIPYGGRSRSVRVRAEKPVGRKSPAATTCTSSSRSQSREQVRISALVYSISNTRERRNARTLLAVPRANDRRADREESCPRSTPRSAFCASPRGLIPESRSSRESPSGLPAAVSHVRANLPGGEWRLDGAARTAVSDCMHHRDHREIADTREGFPAMKVRSIRTSVFYDNSASAPRTPGKRRSVLIRVRRKD